MSETVYLGIPSVPAPTEQLFIAESEAPMKPIREVIVNVASRCDLDCPQCPVYHLEDSSWSEEPRFPSDEVLEKTGQAINEHALEHELDLTSVILFGGEPCAAGVGPIKNAVEKLLENTPDVKLEFNITTNGIRLGKDPELRAYLQKIGCKVAISLDGDKVMNDKYRVHRAGKNSKRPTGTYDEIVAGIKIWNEENDGQDGKPDNRAGILVTIHDPTDPDNDPVRIYDQIATFKPRAMDFLLNYGEFGKREPVRDFYEITDETPTEYGDFLIKAYDHHMQLPPGKRMSVRTFNAYTNLLNGFDSGSTTIGLTDMRLVTISTSGEVDLDVAYNGAFDKAAKTGVSVYDAKAFNKVLRHPLMVVNQLGLTGLSKTCQVCPVWYVCAGGLPASRFWHEPSDNESLTRIARLFDRPSAYCADLGKLALHILNRLAPETSAEMQNAIAAMPSWPPASSPRKPVYPTAQI